MAKIKIDWDISPRCRSDQMNDDLSEYQLTENNAENYKTYRLGKSNQEGNSRYVSTHQSFGDRESQERQNIIDYSSPDNRPSRFGLQLSISRRTLAVIAMLVAVRAVPMNRAALKSY